MDARPVAAEFLRLASPASVGALIEMLDLLERQALEKLVTEADEAKMRRLQGEVKGLRGLRRLVTMSSGPSGDTSVGNPYTL